MSLVTPEHLDRVPHPVFTRSKTERDELLEARVVLFTTHVEAWMKRQEQNGNTLIYLPVEEEICLEMMLKLRNAGWRVHDYEAGAIRIVIPSRRRVP